MVRRELKERVTAVLRDKGLDADETLRRMREMNVVMEGPPILQVLLPDCNVGHVLSFCCPGWGKGAFSQFLLSAGYSVEEEDDQTVELPDDGSQDCHTGCQHVTTLRNGDGCTVTVNESVSMSPLVPIFFAETTASINYVSADGVACLYPEMTLYKMALTNYARAFLDEDRQAGMTTYIANGFRIVDTCENTHNHPPIHHLDSLEEELPVNCQQKPRRINGPDALMVPFTKGGFVPVRPFVRWRLGYNWRLENGALRNRDVIISVESEGGSFIEYNHVQPRFNLEDALYGHLDVHFDEW
ncbi:hypothetical protein DFP72DRAFT_1067851 [Ephemerocybe angulata]|uniref:Uncharacterized protein n=1 Tax=Ephemerocybe angulata TaxID=980116 RepID=A0A8H6M7N7_9AGAR|nr:hypothetical protein DFP72DRAFT_1067851 [Tulosesus angulatus]